MIKAIIYTVLLGVLSAGGYYFHSNVKATETAAELENTLMDLQQALLRKNAPVRPGDITRFIHATVDRLEPKKIELQKIQVFIDPLDDTSINKLPAPTRTALNIARKIPNTRTPAWVLGFTVDFQVHVGWVALHRSVSHAIPFDSAQP